MMIEAFLVGLLLFLLVVSVRSYVRVDEGFIGVVTSFGAAKRDGKGHLLRLTPGLHFKAPWEAVQLVCVKEQSLDLSGEEGGRSAMAADGTVLRFDSILRFVPLEGELEKFVFGMKAPLEHVTALFTCLLRNEIANFSAAGRPPSNALAMVPGPVSAPSLGFAADDSSYAIIRRERQSLNERIESFCRSEIGDRYGLRFSAVDLTDILPPDELANALNAVMQARVEAATLFARTESECQQRVLSAAQGVSLAAAHAEAMQIEIEGIAAHLTQLAHDRTLDDYVARRRAEVLGESRTHYVKRGSS